jgi:hypothetical protein
MVPHEVWHGSGGSAAAVAEPYTAAVSAAAHTSRIERTVRVVRVLSMIKPRVLVVD